jgi:hypothetical protein
LEARFFAFTTPDSSEATPVCVRSIRTAKGWVFVLLPALTPELYREVIADLQTEASRMESERLMLKAMEPPDMRK